MSAVPYPKYKDSEVEWLGQVPNSWEIRKLKTLANITTAKAESRLFPVALEHVEGWVGRLNGLVSELELSGEGIAFRSGDVLFGKLRPYLAKAWVADRPGEAVGDFLVIRPHAALAASFLRYLMLTPTFISLVNGSTYGSKMPRAGWDFIRNIEWAIPNLSVQQSIADYLDRETAAIDAFIADQEVLIALLNERRTATITRAVTKGLDPVLPMKDSGVPWLGAIPVRWTVQPIKRASSIRGRIGFRGYTTADLVQDGKGAIALSPGNMRSGCLRWQVSTYISWEKYVESPEIMVQSGDTLLVKTGSTFGKTSFAEIPKNRSVTVNPQIVILRPLEINSRFFYYAVSNSRVHSEFRSYPTGGTTPTMTETRIGTIQIAVPSNDEQEQIATYLDLETAAMDSAIDDAHQAISFSKERRAAVISAAVTGKIDVRGLATQPATEMECDSVVLGA